MAERKKTPNILADLLGDKIQSPTVEDGEPAKSQSDLTVKPQDVKTAHGQSVQNAPSSRPDESEEESEGNGGNKVKVTFYLSEESVDLLEDAQRQLRRLNRGMGKTKSKAATSKSALLEEALKLACADLESKGRESQLARILS